VLLHQSSMDCNALIREPFLCSFSYRLRRAANSRLARTSILSRRWFSSLPEFAPAPLWHQRGGIGGRDKVRCCPERPKAGRRGLFAHPKARQCHLDDKWQALPRRTLNKCFERRRYRAPFGRGQPLLHAMKTTGLWNLFLASLAHVCALSCTAALAYLAGIETIDPFSNNRLYSAPGAP
jgi:hypothetical protein